MTSVYHFVLGGGVGTRVDGLSGVARSCLGRGMTRSGNGGDCGRTFRCCSALKPAVECPVLPHKIDFSLVQLELGFEQFDGAGSLLQASVLLVLGRHQLTGRASAGSRELQQDGLQLLLREIAIDRGQLDARRIGKLCVVRVVRGSRLLHFTLTPGEKS